MKPALIAFDLDGTLLTKNSSFAFCRYLFKSGLFSLSDYLFCVSCFIQHRFRGKSLLWLHEKVFERLFQGKSWSFFDTELDAFIEKILPKILYKPALTRWQQSHSQERWIVSNSPTFIVERVAKYLGGAKVFATLYSLDKSQKLCKIERLVDGKAKGAFLHSLGASDSVVYTDSHLDLPFLEAATFPVAVRPNRKLRQIARAKGWEIL